jgi:hypothetical protein
MAACVSIFGVISFIFWGVERRPRQVHQKLGLSKLSKILN